MSDDLPPLILGIHVSTCCLGARPAVLPDFGSSANPSRNHRSRRSDRTIGKADSQESDGEGDAEACGVRRLPVLAALGVIAGTGDIFVVQKIGLTVFGNDYAEVPVSWGLDDLVFARVRAAAGNTPVRRIAYAKGALDSCYHPKSGLFRNQREELSNLIRQVAPTAGCERYLVVMRSEGQLDGTNLSLSGVGIFSRGVGLISYAYVFAYIGVTWVDGRTFEIMKGPAVTFEGVMKHMADNFVSNELLQKVDKSMFPETAADFANNTALRDTTRDFLTKRLDKILPPYFAQ